MSSDAGSVAHPVRIETPRLLLDAHVTDDFAALAALWADPQIVRYIGGRQSSAQESWMRLLRYRGLWALLGYGYWAVREKSSGKYIGDLGFADFHRACEPSIIGVPEAGWVIAGWAQGQGFAREALGAALVWLDASPTTNRSCCLIAPDNGASIHLAESHGFARRGTVVVDGKDSLLFYRFKP